MFPVLVFAQEREVPKEEVVVRRQSTLPMNAFFPNTIKVGDSIAGMTLLSVEKKDDSHSLFTFAIPQGSDLSGNRSLTGWDSSGRRCFILDRESLQLIPYSAWDISPTEVCLYPDAYPDGSTLGNEIADIPKSQVTLSLTAEKLRIYTSHSYPPIGAASYTLVNPRLSDEERAAFDATLEKQAKEYANELAEQEKQETTGVFETNPLFSPNKKMKAWIHQVGAAFRKHTITLFVSSADGSNKKAIHTKTFPELSGSFYFELIKWNKAGNGLYFYQMPDGVGSVANYSGYASLSFIDIQKKKVKELVPYKGFDRNFVTNISSSEQYVAHITDNYVYEGLNDGKKPVLHIKNIKNGKDIKFNIPNKKYKALGNAIFSPNEKYIAFNAGPVSGDGVTAVLIASVDGGKPRILKTFKKESFDVIGWQSNSLILLSGRENKYTLSLDGKTLRKIK